MITTCFKKTIFILILINSVVTVSTHYAFATDRTANESVASIYLLRKHQTNSVQVIKSFLTELSSTESITDSFIRKHLSIDDFKEVDSHLISALEQVKDHYETYRQNDISDLQVQEFKGIELDPKKKFYFINLTGGRSLNFSIDQGKIAGIFMYIDHEHSTYIYYSGVID